MKRILLITIVCITHFGFTGCSKGGSSGGGSGGGGTVTPTEQNLSISISPDPGTSVVTALAASYAFKVVINSTPPTNGVKIDITGTKESDNSVQFSQTSQTSS